MSPVLRLTSLVVACVLTSCTAALARDRAGFEGKYEYLQKAKDGSGAWGYSIEIKHLGGRRYQGSFEVGTPNCIGQLEADGELKGKLLILQDGEDPDICTVFVRKQRQGVRVDEVLPCYSAHGFACSFSGSASRVAR